MKHILMTADAAGGVWTYSLELARCLRQLGIQVSLAVMGGRLTPAQRAQVTDAYDSDYRLEWMEDPWQDVDAAGDWLLQLERDLRPDLIHLNGMAHGNLRWHAPVMMVFHSCVLSWWEAVHGEAAPPTWEEYRRRVRAGLHAADIVATVSHATAGTVSRLYGPLEVNVIPNGLQADCYRPGNKEDLVLSCGRMWDLGKNVASLDAAAPDVCWPVAVAGEAHDLKNVQALGKLTPEELRTWYSRASIYALPAKYEPFGYSAVEAALSGCALVLGDIPSLREIWEEDALFVPPSDTEALSVTINALARDKVYRQEMAERARTRALRYSAERMTEAYLNLAGALCAS